MRITCFRYVLTVLALHGLGGHAGARNDPGDSLRVLLAQAQHDTVRMRLYKLITGDWLYNHAEMDSTIVNAQRGAALFDRLPTAQRSPLRSVRMKLFEYEGFALHQLSRNTEALERLQQGARLARELEQPLEEAGFYMYMAQVMRVMKDNASMLRFCRMAQAIQEPLGPSTDLALTYYHLAGYHLGELHCDSAEVFAKRALAYFRQDHDAMRTIAGETLLLEIYHRSGQLDSAEVHLKAAEAVAREVDYTPSFTLLYGMRGRIGLYRGRYVQALADIDSSMALSERTGLPYDKHEVFALRGLALAAVHRMDEAFTALDSSEAVLLRDMGLDQQRELAESRMTFEQERTNALAAAALKEQRWSKWMAIGAATLLSVIAAVLWRLFRLRTRTAAELRTKNEEIRRTAAQLVLAEKRREAEQVRTRIARDIHDEIGATLTKIRLLSDVAATNDPQQHDDTRRSLLRIGEHARHVSGAMSDIVWAVDPARDTHQGMLEHVRELARRLLGDNGITFDLDLSCTLGTTEMEPELRRDIHLLINEAFNNILKYAKARHVKVKLMLDTERFTLSIEDDGSGFEEGTVTGTGNGLRNMRERARRHGGDFRITSAKGRGTRVEAHGRFH